MGVVEERVVVVTRAVVVGRVVVVGRIVVVVVGLVVVVSRVVEVVDDELVDESLRIEVSMVVVVGRTVVVVRRIVVLVVVVFAAMAAARPRRNSDPRLGQRWLKTKAWKSNCSGSSSSQIACRTPGSSPHSRSAVSNLSPTSAGLSVLPSMAAKSSASVGPATSSLPQAARASEIIISARK